MNRPPPFLGPFGRLARGVLEHRRLALALAALLVGVAAVLALRIRLDFSSTAFYGGDDPDAVALRRFHERWGSDDSTLLVLAEAEPPGVLDVAPLARLQALHEDLAATPGVREVVDLDTLTPSLGPGDASMLESFKSADARTRAALRGVMRSSPAVPRLLSEDGRRTVLAVRLDRSSDDVQGVTPRVERVRAVVDEHDGEGGLRLELAGLPAIRASFYTLALGDQLRLGPVVGLSLALLLWLSFRRWHGVAIPLGLTGIPVVGLVGVMAATGEPIGLLNQAYFTLLPVIAVADGVHLVARMHEALRRHDVDPGQEQEARRAAVLEACDHTGVACLLTSVTTGLGFASLALAQMPMLRRFGLYAALGIGLAYATLLLLGPLLLDAIRARPPAARPGMVALARWSARRVHPAAVVGVTLALAGLAGLCGRAVVIDNALSDLLPATHPVRRASAEVDEHLGGTLSLEVELVAAEAWLQPPRLASITEFEAWAAKQPEVRAVSGPTLVHRLRATTDSSGPQARRLRSEVLDDSETRARVSITTPDIGGRAFAALADRVQRRARALPAEVTVTGTAKLAYQGVNRIASELRESLLGVVLVVSVTIAVLLRSVRLALVALVPNVLPLALAYGSLPLLDIELDPLAAVILCVALSIAVDDSLHLLTRLREERARGRPPTEALEQAVAHSGYASLMTSVALTGGLAINLLSSFPPLQLLGGLGAGAIALAWLCDVAILPGLLRAASREYREVREARDDAAPRDRS